MSAFHYVLRAQPAYSAGVQPIHLHRNVQFYNIVNHFSSQIIPCNCLFRWQLVFRHSVCDDNVTDSRSCQTMSSDRCLHFPAFVCIQKTGRCRFTWDSAGTFNEEHVVLNVKKSILLYLVCVRVCERAYMYYNVLVRETVREGSSQSAFCMCLWEREWQTQGETESERMDGQLPGGNSHSSIHSALRSRLCQASILLCIPN